MPKRLDIYLISSGRSVVAFNRSREDSLARLFGGESVHLVYYCLQAVSVNCVEK